MEQWEIVHYWDWFRRSQWLDRFRNTKLLLGDAVLGLLKERGLNDGTLLDCSCGLGSQAITFAESGLHVTGSDRSGFSVSCALEMAKTFRQEITFFESRWEDLPVKTMQRFDTVFCDALSWLHTDEEMAAALRGLRGVLRLGGILIFQGAAQGSEEPDFRRDFEVWWESLPGPAVRWRHTEGTLNCTSLSVPSRGENYIDWRLLYLIEDAGTQRLEHVAIRESLRWNGKRFAEMARSVGFDLPVTRDFRAWSPNGRPTALNYVVAV